MAIRNPISPITFCLLALSLFQFNDALSDSDPVVVAISSIVSARDTVRGYVLDISNNYKPTSPEYIKAQTLYRTATGKYNAWGAVVADAIVTGSTRKLNKDDAYKKVSSDATQASTAFTDYVESVRSQTKGVSLSVLGNLVDLGIRIWNGYSSAAKTARATRADNFKSATKWDQWEEILSPTKTPVKGAGDSSKPKDESSKPE